MITITKKFTFEAAHSLPFYDGACSKLHGHSYKLEVTVFSEDWVITEGNCQGMVMDLKELKRLVKENVIDMYDHSNLNDFFECPTAEIMAFVIATKIQSILPESVKLKEVKLWETETGCASYTPDNLPNCVL